MIAAGHPETKENAKALRKSGDDLFFSTSANMLFAKEGDSWIALGHVIPLSGGGRMNRAIHPKVDGNPYGDSMRLMGVKG